MDVVARKWENMSQEEQYEYLKRHRRSRLRPTMSNSDEAIDSLKKALKTYSLNRSVEGKQNVAEQQVNEWADTLKNLGFDEVQTDNGKKFESDFATVELSVTKGKMRYFANFEIKPKFSIAASEFRHLSTIHEEFAKIALRKHD